MAERLLHPKGWDERRVDTLRIEVQALLDKVARAIVSGDGAAMAQLWELPAFVLGDDAAELLADADKVAALFGSGRQQYNARGITGTRADIQDLEKVGERMVIATVRWPYLDATGKQVGAEKSDYTLRRDDRGDLKIRFVMYRGVEPGTH